MKIRTDFVTNSSSSSFVAFHIENPVLAEIMRRFPNTSIRISGSILSGAFENDGSISDAAWDRDAHLELPGNDLASWLEGCILCDSFGTYPDLDTMLKTLETKSEEINKNTKTQEAEYWHSDSEGGYNEFSYKKKTDLVEIYAEVNDDVWDYEKEGEPLWRLLQDRDTDAMITQAKRVGVFRIESIPEREKRDHFMKTAIFPDATGKTFITTGLGSEERFVQEVVERSGGVFKPKFVKSIDFLIYNPEYGRETTKYQNAKALISEGKKVAIITFGEFCKRLKSN